MDIDVRHLEAEARARADACERIVTGLDGGTAAQIARVLARIAPPEAQAIARPAELIAAFRSKGLMPPVLLNACAAHAGVRGLTKESLAICFSAALYPTRAYQLWETGLSRRLAAFVEYLRLSDPAAPRPLDIRDVVAGRLPGGVPPPGLDELLSDLTGANDLGYGFNERAARDAGAELYLTTYHAPLLEFTCGVWQQEAAFLQFLRRSAIQTSLCSLTGDGKADYPDWGWIERRFAADFPDALDSHREQAVILEKMVWKGVRLWNPSLDRSTVQGLVERFWEVTSDKLNSGFPYYAFGSRFVYWWQQCLHVHPWDPDRAEDPDGMPPASQVTQPEEAPVENTVRGDGEFEATEQRIAREHYRVVRQSFFAREDQSAERDRAIRQAVDALWYDRLERTIDVHDTGQKPQAVNAIAERFRLTVDSVNNYNRRLRMRMWAAGLSRGAGKSNFQIQSTPQPGTKREPLRNEKGIFHIATLTRAVPATETLLWAFTAHMFLRPHLGQRAHVWNVSTYVRELWHWVVDDAFRPVVERAAHDGSRANIIGLEAVSSEPIASLIAELRDVPDETAADAYVGSRTFHAEEVAVRALLARLSHNVAVITEPTQLRAWSRMTGSDKTHWIVPVWYLIFVERVSQTETVHRLKPEHDQKLVGDLYDDMHRFV